LDCDTQCEKQLNDGFRLYIHSVNTLQKMIDYLNKYIINLLHVVAALPCFGFLS
jgi:hypothetical protein